MICRDGIGRSGWPSCIYKPSTAAPTNAFCSSDELRVLNIRNIDEGMQIDLVQSLGNLKKMQHLTLGDGSGQINVTMEKSRSILILRDLWAS